MNKLERWFMEVECVEDPVVPAPPDALRILSDWCPDLDDAESLRILSDQFEELGRDASAALLRDVAGRIECGVETYKKFAELLYFDNAAMRRALDRSKVAPTAAP